MIENVAGFFNLMAQWEAEEDGPPDTLPHATWSEVGSTPDPRRWDGGVIERRTVSRAPPSPPPPPTACSASASTPATSSGRAGPPQHPSAHRLARSLAACPGRPRRTRHQAAQAAPPPVRLQRPDPVRPLRLFHGRGDKEGALRLLPLHRLSGEVPRAVRARGGPRATVRGAAARTQPGAGRADLGHQDFVESQRDEKRFHEQGWHASRPSTPIWTSA